MEGAAGRRLPAPVTIGDEYLAEILVELRRLRAALDEPRPASPPAPAPVIATNEEEVELKEPEPQPKRASRRG